MVDVDFGVVYDVLFEDFLREAEERESELEPAKMNDERIIFGGPLLEDLTRNVGSLGEFLLKSLREMDKDTILMIDASTGRSLQLRELIESSLKVAAFLSEIGIREGDVVEIVSENCLEFPVIVFGSLYLGATVSACNPHYANKEMRHVLQLTRPRIIFTSGSALNAVLAVTACHDCDFVQDIVSLGCDRFAKGKTIPFEDILRNRSLKMPEDFKPPPVNMKDRLALIQISSGTTGLPKAVATTQDNLLYSLSANRTVRGGAGYPYNVCFSVPPFCHSYGVSVLFNAILGRLTIVFLPKFSGEKFLQAIERYKVESLLLVPSLWSFLAKSPLVDKFDLSSVKVVFSGAAALSKEVEEGVAKRFPTMRLVQGYGMTEATVGLISRRNEAYKPGSIGSVYPGVYCKVVDPATGRVCGTNEPGELCFRGRVVMKHYLNNEVATREIIDSDGWLHSGDIGKYDENQHFYIVDRIKELIKFKGFQVPPAELEDILLSHPAVLDVAVIGIPSSVAGEVPRAFVVQQIGVPVTEKELIEFVAEKVSDHKRLRGGVQFVTNIPRNANGKIMRRELRKLATIPVSKL